MGHVGEDVNRIQPLLGGGEVKEPFQRVGDIIKERLLQAQPPDDIPHDPEGAGGNIGAAVRRVGDVQRLMPNDVEGKLTNRLFVGQVLNMQQKDDAEHGVQLFGSTPFEIIVVGKQLLRRQLVEYLLPKQMRPGGFQKSEPFRAEILEGIEHVILFVVLDVNHGVFL
jgi:hypothetical protein